MISRHVTWLCNNILNQDRDEVVLVTFLLKHYSIFNCVMSHGTAI